MGQRGRATQPIRPAHDREQQKTGAEKARGSSEHRWPVAKLIFDRHVAPAPENHYQQQFGCDDAVRLSAGHARSLSAVRSGKQTEYGVGWVCVASGIWSDAERNLMFS